jgi:hypothetical protein
MIDQPPLQFSASRLRAWEIRRCCAAQVPRQDFASRALRADPVAPHERNLRKAPSTGLPGCHFLGLNCARLNTMPYGSRM